MNHERHNRFPPIYGVLKSALAAWVLRVVLLNCISLLPFASNAVGALGLQQNLPLKWDLRQEPPSDSTDQAVFDYPFTSERKKQPKQQPHLYLLSLQWTNGDAPGPFSKPVADIWRWKDAVLGDGRDFFVPKPNTLRALQSFLMRPDTSRGWEISECVVVSNCARFEILLVVHDGTSQIDQQQLTERVVSDISSLLIHQVHSHLKHKNSFVTTASAVMDWPGLIHSNPRPTDDNAPLLQPEIQEVSKYWTVLSGTRDIVHHLCLVAAGLATRPRRPQREIVFQPFSSRDAHILLQLKRTVDIASDRTKSSPAKSSSHLLTLLTFALQAGKAARNPHQLPALMELRNQYGETGNSRKYDMVPPPETMQKVIQAVLDEVIHPIVKQCVDHFIAKEAALDIAIFRNRALSMAENPQERQFIQSKLHEPTLRFRQMKQSESRIVNSDHASSTCTVNWNASMFWERLTTDLCEFRQNGTSNGVVHVSKI
jgi:hypothetical protein